MAWSNPAFTEPLLCTSPSLALPGETQVQFLLWRKTAEDQYCGEGLKAEKLFEGIFRRQGCPSGEGPGATQLWRCVQGAGRPGWEWGLLEKQAEQTAEGKCLGVDVLS